ncbi:MAG: hypothetical protein IMZ66_12865 [Planctomycetes bacterium]|nr:hypothetical protein [Planctomycetota bacterium]
MAKRTPTPARRWAGIALDARAPPGGCRPRRPAPPGFALVELLAVVVIMGLLAFVIVPRLADSAVWGTQAEAAARQVGGTLRLARRMAIANAAANPSGYVVRFGLTDYGIQNSSGVAQAPRVALPAAWTFVQANATVTFDVYGGAQASVALPTGITLVKGAQRWAVRIEPATGYVWYEEN